MDYRRRPQAVETATTQRQSSGSVSEWVVSLTFKYINTVKHSTFDNLNAVNGIVLTRPETVLFLLTETKIEKQTTEK